MRSKREKKEAVCLVEKKVCPILNKVKKKKRKEFSTQERGKK